MSVLGALAVLLGGLGALDPAPRRGAAARRDHPRHRAGRRGRSGAGSVRLAPRRDRRAVALDQRVPARHASTTRSSTARWRRRRRRASAARSNLSAEIAAFTGVDRDATSPSSAPSATRCWNPPTHLSEAADRASRRTEGATAASAEASANVRDIASATDELAASVMEIDRQVAQSNAIAEKAVGEAERTNAAVQELNEAAKRIGDVVSLITDIAEQTNLLALNATIEAARAGEAGRGFAVVAGEVKALAGQTAKATEDIATQIADMQHATSRSIEAIEAIEGTIRDIGAISGAIAAAVTEQGAATQEIARSVDVAAKRTLETADEVSRVGDATENTRTNVTTVRVGGGRARRRRPPHPRPDRGVLAEACARRRACRAIPPRTPPGCGAGFFPARPARRRTGCRFRRPRDARRARRRPRRRSAAAGAAAATTPRRRAWCAPSPRRTPARRGGARRCRPRRPGF